MLPLKGRCQEIPHRFFPTNFHGPIDIHRKDLDFFVVVEFFITSWIYPPDTNLQAVLASDVKKQQAFLQHFWENFSFRKS